MSLYKTDTCLCWCGKMSEYLLVSCSHRFSRTELDFSIKQVTYWFRKADLFEIVKMATQKDGTLYSEQSDCWRLKSSVPCRQVYSCCWQPTLHKNPEDSILYHHCCENLVRSCLRCTTVSWDELSSKETGIFIEVLTVAHTCDGRFIQMSCLWRTTNNFFGSRKWSVIFSLLSDGVYIRIKLSKDLFLPRHFQSENLLPAHCDFPAVVIVSWTGEKRQVRRREGQR
jgi:hypothetical protein